LPAAAEASVGGCTQLTGPPRLARSHPPPWGAPRAAGHLIRDCPKIAEERAAGRQERPTKAQLAAAAAVERSGFKHPNEGCWFCLANPQVEKHLVVSVGSECYLALAKGALTPDHVLIIPLGHFPSTGELPESARAELEQYKAALRTAFEAAGKAPLFFEVNTRSPHTHVQVIPVPKEKAAAVGPVLEVQAAKLGFKLETEDPADGLRGSYFRAELPEAGKVLFRAIGPADRFPVQFGRHSMANLLELPDRMDWKACVKPTDAEKADAAAFRAFFRPYDFTLADA